MAKEGKVVVVKGNLIKLRKEAKTFKGKKGDEKTYITLQNVELSDEDINIFRGAFAKSGEKFTPAWVKEFEGFVNLSTTYDLPAKIYTGEEFKSALDYVADNDFYNAEAELAINVKDGALYPKAIKINTAGEEYDAFADFE